MRAAFVILFVWGGVGCGSEEAVLCTTDAECAEGEACNAIVGICARRTDVLPENAARGSFSCTVVASSGDKQPATGSLALKVDGEEAFISQTISCVAGKALNVSIHGLARHKSPYAEDAGTGFLGLTLGLPPPLVSPGAVIKLGEQNNAFRWLAAGKAERGWGTIGFSRYDCPCLELESIAEVTGGGVVLVDGSATVGERISGQLELALTRYGTKPRTGVTCKVTAECGDRLGATLCAKSATAAEADLGFCSSFCKTDADCASYAAPSKYCSPTIGVCATVCASTAECPAGLVCVNDTAAGKKACVPPNMTK
jgi:hypothetical protein